LLGILKESCGEGQNLNDLGSRRGLPRDEVGVIAKGQLGGGSSDEENQKFYENVVTVSAGGRLGGKI